MVEFIHFLLMKCLKQHPTKKTSVAGLKILFAEPSDKMSDAFEFGSDKMYDNVQ